MNKTTKRGPYPLEITKNDDYFVIITNLGYHYAKTFDPSAARLIAAAPDLLDALKGAVGYVEMEGGYLNDPYWYTAAKCAIAKAEGKA